MELLLGFLCNPKFRLRPVVKLLQDYIEPLRKDYAWGALLPYNITGQMNRHPQAAIKFLGSDEKSNFIKFFDEIVTDRATQAILADLSILAEPVQSSPGSPGTSKAQ